MLTVGSSPSYGSNDRYVQGRLGLNSSQSEEPTQSSLSSFSTSGAILTESSSVSNFKERLASLTLNNGLDVARAKPVWELPEDQYQDYLATERDYVDMRTRVLQHDHTQYPDNPDDPSFQPYANIVVGGRVVATINNQGVVSTTDEQLGQRLLPLSQLNTGLDGPELAQHLAEQIAKMLGGEIVPADTALEQSVYERLAAAAIPVVDYEGMTSDPKYTEIESRKTELDKIELSRQQYLKSVEP